MPSFCAGSYGGKKKVEFIHTQNTEPYCRHFSRILAAQTLFGTLAKEFLDCNKVAIYKNLQNMKYLNKTLCQSFQAEKTRKSTLIKMCNSFHAYHIYKTYRPLCLRFQWNFTFLQIFFHGFLKRLLSAPFLRKQGLKTCSIFSLIEHRMSPRINYSNKVHKMIKTSSVVFCWKLCYSKSCTIDYGSCRRFSTF